MANKRKKITYKVNLPNELKLEGQAKARYTTMQTYELITMDYTPERAVRNVVRRQTRDNEFYGIAILNALKSKAGGSIGKYAAQLQQRTDTSQYNCSNDLSSVVSNQQGSKQLNLF